jgi:hypothetical protein
MKLSIFNLVNIMLMVRVSGWDSKQTSISKRETTPTVNKDLCMIQLSLICIVFSYASRILIVHFRQWLWVLDCCSAYNKINEMKTAM